MKTRILTPGHKGKRTEGEKTRVFAPLRSFFPLVLVLLAPALLSGNGDEPVSTSRELEFAPTGVEEAGEFFAEVEIRDHLLAVDEYMMRVQVHPTPLNPPVPRSEDPRNGTSGGTKGGWPQTQIPRTAFAADIQVLIKLRGVSVPKITSARDRPMTETRRETIRFDEAMRFVWHLMDATDHLVLTNPEVVSGTEMVMCDVYFELAGVRLSLADALVVAGHARYEPHDWGKRIVQRDVDKR